MVPLYKRKMEKNLVTYRNTVQYKTSTKYSRTTGYPWPLKTFLKLLLQYHGLPNYLVKQFQVDRESNCRKLDLEVFDRAHKHG
eukprot:g39959.t1